MKIKELLYSNKFIQINLLLIISTIIIYITNSSIINILKLLGSIIWLITIPAYSILNIFNLKKNYLFSLISISLSLFLISIFSHYFSIFFNIKVKTSAIYIPIAIIIFSYLKTYIQKRKNNLS